MRKAKPAQGDIGAAIIERNIYRILHESNNFKTLINTLVDFIKSRNTTHVYMIDAPNLLKKHLLNFSERQSMSANLYFTNAILSAQIPNFDEKKSVIIVVTQMNHRQWPKGNDPIWSGPIDNNAYIIRVGCYDDNTGKDCFKIKTGYDKFTGNDKFLGNECDDFVRLDVMARIINNFLKEGLTPPTFYLVSNDKSTNWQCTKPHISWEHIPLELDEKWFKSIHQIGQTQK